MYVDVGWIGQMDVVDQYGVGDIVLMDMFQFGQLNFVVDFQYFLFVFWLCSVYWQFFGDGECDDVGQVVFVLCIVV